jgi:hypothetical protein
MAREQPRRGPHRMLTNLLVMSEEAAVNKLNKPMSDSRSTASPVRLSSSPARSYRSWLDEEKARMVGDEAR